MIGLKSEYITTFYLGIQHFISSDIYSNCISLLLLLQIDLVPITNEEDSIRIDRYNIIVTDGGEEHVDSIVSDAITSSSSLLHDNGLS